MGRKAKLNWEVYKEQLLELRYNQKKSLTDINKILYEKLGFCFTNARLSQIFTQWASAEKQIQEDREVFERNLGAEVNAN